MTEKKPELPLPGEETLKLNTPYVIMAVDDFESEVQGYHGWRVVLDGGGDEILAMALWYRDIVGRMSKLGAFLAALGNEKDAWAGRTVKFLSWEKGDRVLEVVEK